MKRSSFILVCMALLLSGIIVSCKTIERMNENQQYAEKLWEVKIKRGVFSSIALDEDENIYFGTEGDGVYALTSDGEELWHYMEDKKHNFSASPTLGANNTLYIGASNGILYAFNTETGRIKWKFITTGSIFATIAIATDGTLYVASKDYKLYAVDPEEGKMLWFKNTEGALIASPVVDAEGTIYVSSRDGYIYVLNPDGSEKWRYKSDAGEFNASPAIDLENKLLFSATSAGRVYALNTENAQLKWFYTMTGGIFSSIILGEDGTVYVIDVNGVVKAFSPNAGEVLWSYQVTGNVYGTPAIGEDGTLYVVSVKKESKKGYLSILKKDGTLLWLEEFSRDLRSSPVIGDDGTVYLASKLGRIYALRGYDRGPAKHPGAMFGVNRSHTFNYAERMSDENNTDVDNEATGDLSESQ